jgi:hypothetical protein
MIQSDSILTLRSIIWFIVIGALAILPGFLFGPPLGHSLANNLVWLASFDAGLWRGELYPRWMPELWFGSGAPDFFFYGPLPFWVTSIFGRGICWSCDIPTLLNAGSLIILALSGLGYFLFASRFLDLNRALIAAGIYMILPYHLMIDWGLRQALGELGAFSVFPFIAYFLAGLSRGERWSGVGFAVSVAALILCHLPSVVICATVLIPAAIYYGYEKKQSPRAMFAFFGSAVLWAFVGLGISAFYWLPAFGLLSEVSSQTLWQSGFNWSHWLFFDGTPEPNEALTMLMKVWLIGVSIFTGVVFTRLRKNTELAVWVTLPFLIAWVFLTPLSWPLWQYLPFLQAIQFPWRFMMIAEFGLPLAIGCLIPQVRRGIFAAGLVVAIFSLLNGFGGYQLGNILGVPRSLVEGNIRDHLSAWEYLPKTAFDPILKLTGGKRDVLRGDWTSTPGEVSQLAVVSGEAKTDARLISSRHWLVDVEAVTPAHIVFRQFYWKLWSAHDVATGAEIKISPEVKFGLIEFDVPAGKTSVSLDLDLHWSEKLGFVFSLVGLAIIVFGIGRQRTVHLKAVSVASN